MTLRSSRYLQYSKKEELHGSICTSTESGIYIHLAFLILGLIMQQKSPDIACALRLSDGASQLPSGEYSTGTTQLPNRIAPSTSSLVFEDDCIHRLYDEDILGEILSDLSDGEFVSDILCDIEEQGCTSSNDEGIDWHINTLKVDSFPGESSRRVGKSRHFRSRCRFKPYTLKQAMPAPGIKYICASHTYRVGDGNEISGAGSWFSSQAVSLNHPAIIIAHVVLIYSLPELAHQHLSSESMSNTIAPPTISKFNVDAKYTAIKANATLADQMLR
ncbi:hypothetical protein K493DRAFT_298991 [Basidiobolus meristosporus CBS 931.73]|uniref:Uncharacterized protein n=1 Tax=Basidiobolus meristosporus CBS 931.73 TaxID=1314790 RepID=A0A1Y1YQB0_9FUNG|nr:hypothetical protein K493DRAFT_298991 [Basidiobolus meristosporus CBS 931.73]|eukprot:ORY00210.1 hypothetical protein K493DRAFT_298991 [Basidiobolus meristosporus CBS 931.73]